MKTAICVIALFIVAWLLQGCASVPQNEQVAPLSEPKLIQGGFICNTYDEAVVMTFARLYQAAPYPDGCGVLSGMATARIRILEELDTGFHIAKMAEFHFVGGAMDGMVQYGVFGVPQRKAEAKEDEGRVRRMENGWQI